MLVHNVTYKRLLLSYNLLSYNKEYNKERKLAVIVRLLLLFSFIAIMGLSFGKHGFGKQSTEKPAVNKQDIEEPILEKQGSKKQDEAKQPGQTIYLEANQVDIDDKQQISIYKGNVKLSRGDITILADKITAKKNSKGLGKLLATGNPVKFSKIQHAGQKEIKGQALEIEYDTEKEIMKLKNEAKLWQANDQFSGNLIIYNIAQESVTANMGGAKNGRVQVIIHPDNNSGKNNQVTPD